CSGPCASDPATGWPPMKRGCVTAAQTGPFVEPTSVTVQRSPLASTTAETWAGRVATGEATTASSASRTASSSRSPGSSIAPRSAASSSAAGSGSKPRTSSTPARLAASPIEAPISPVPTTAPRRVRRVDDHGQVRLLLQDRDGADVEREPHRGLEGLDPTLAEDHARVPLLDDVLGRHQELLDGRREAALEQHRLVGAADLAE